MHFLYLLPLVLPVVHSLDPTPADLSSSSCATLSYDPSEYACYDTPPGAALCPIINGEATEICEDQCYTPSQYRYVIPSPLRLQAQVHHSPSKLTSLFTSCNNVTLSELPVYNGPIALTADNPEAPFHGLPVQAAGENFFLGHGNGAYCPSDVPPADCPPGNQTVLLGGYLSVSVPGGQQLYIQTSGALAYTQAHSTLMTNMSMLGGGTPYENAGYFGPNGSYWVACPGATAYQVFANLPSVVFADDCVGFYAVVEDLPQGTVGAWQYE